MTQDTAPRNAPDDSDDLDEFEEGEGGPNDGRLRSAMLQDGQPWLTWWLPIPGIAVALTWGAYQAVSSAEPGLNALLAALLWPGSTLFIVTTLVTYFGWRLDLD
jgi:hypothetical protein